MFLHQPEFEIYIKNLLAWKGKLCLFKQNEFVSMFVCQCRLEKKFLNGVWRQISKREVDSLRIVIRAFVVTAFEKSVLIII